MLFRLIIWPARHSLGIIAAQFISWGESAPTKLDYKVRVWQYSRLTNAVLSGEAGIGFA
jgi:hypothetical protein